MKFVRSFVFIVFNFITTHVISLILDKFSQNFRNMWTRTQSSAGAGVRYEAYDSGHSGALEPKNRQNSKSQVLLKPCPSMNAFWKGLNESFQMKSLPTKSAVFESSLKAHSLSRVPHF